jgi:hypothetical protein
MLHHNIQQDQLCPIRGYDTRDRSSPCREIERFVIVNIIKPGTRRSLNKS